MTGIFIALSFRLFDPGGRALAAGHHTHRAIPVLPKLPETTSEFPEVTRK
jgi:hypothetical protein